MLKIEVIRFEAQDVITSSITVPAETEAPTEATVAPTEGTEATEDPCANGHNVTVIVKDGTMTAECTVCGKGYEGEGPFTGGDLE